MEKRGQRKIIFIVSGILIFIIVVLALCLVIKNRETKMSDNEIREIVSKITDDEIIRIDYYKEYIINPDDYVFREVYVATVKLSEPYSMTIFGEGEADYKIYIIEKHGNILNSFYKKGIENGN